jgi:iron(III) transport system substrate-binding protein
MKKNYLKFLLLLTMIMVLLTACSSQGTGQKSEDSSKKGTSNSNDFSSQVSTLTYDDLVKKAKDEGRVVVYGPNPAERFDKVKKEFENQFGIEVLYTQINGGDLANRVNSEYQSGKVQVDAIQQADDVMLNEFKDKGYLLKVDHYVTPELAEKANALVTDGYLTPIQYSPMGIMYDSSRMEEPKKWEDLLKPELKGQIGITDPGNQNLFISLLSTLRDEFGDKYITDLRKQVKVYADHSLVANNVMGKELVAAVTTTGTAMSLINKQQGTTIKFTDNLGITDGAPLYQVLTTKGANHYAGLLFMNWTLSKEGQQLLNGGGMAATPLKDVTIDGVRTIPAGYQPADYAKAIKERDSILELFQEK